MVAALPVLAANAPLAACALALPPPSLVATALVAPPALVAVIAYSCAICGDLEAHASEAVTQYHEGPTPRASGAGSTGARGESAPPIGEAPSVSHRDITSMAPVTPLSHRRHWRWLSGVREKGSVVSPMAITNVLPEPVMRLAMKTEGRMRARTCPTPTPSHMRTRR